MYRAAGTACLLLISTIAVWFLPASAASGQGPDVGVSAGAEAGLVLVEDGQSRYVIVLGAEALPSEKFAAEELVSHIRLMSGAELKTVELRGDPAGLSLVPCIVLGSQAAERFYPDADFGGVGDEGYRLRTVGRNVVIAGGGQRGTMYGVYALLESIGVRWWYPGETHIPSMKTIRIPATDVFDAPKLSSRNIMYAEGHNQANHIWYVRNRLNAVGWSPISARMGGDTLPAGVEAHNSVDYVESSVSEMKPEMWAWFRGNRSREEICPSHDEVVAATVKSLANIYRKHPDTPYVVVGHEDNNVACQCDRCAAIAAREGLSGPWWHFINRVAEDLEKDVPGALVSSGAYLWTRPPPKTEKLRHNVIVRFAPIETDYAHPLADASNPQNAKVKEDISAWSRVAPALMIWTYVGNRAHYLMPNPDLNTLVSNVKFFADHRSVGIMQQGTHVGAGTEFVPLRMWVLAKALWNPEADGAALIREFLDGYYGPAAPHIAEYINVMHRYGRANDYHLGRVTRMNAPFLQPEIIAEAEEVLRKADQAVAGNAELERRVRHAHMPIWYVLAKRGPLSRTWRATEQRVGKLDFAEIAAQLNRVATDYRITAVADPEVAAPFFQWLTDYGRLAKDGRAVLPPELNVDDLGIVRLLQARQIDSGWIDRTGAWVRDPAASDGWALRVASPRWTIQHHFSRHEEAAGAKRFKLFVRVRRGDLATGDAGGAFVCGTRGDTITVSADQLADGRYHVFEVGQFDVADDMMMYIALTRPSALKEVFLDALWLMPVE